MGIRTSAEKHNEDHIIRILSPYFADSVSEEITVFLIDDAFLERTKQYPVNYSNLARLLKVIGIYKPDAVFFDILQHQEHSDKLSKWIKRLKESDFPVLLASAPNYDSPQRLSDPNSIRHKLSQVSQFSAVMWSDYQHYYPFSVTVHGKSHDTVASSLYKIWCENHPERCAYNPDNSSEFSEKFSDPMIVQWGNQFNPDQASLLYMNEKCEVSDDSPLQQVINIFVGLAGQGISDQNEIDKLLRVRCPPVTAVSATALIDSGAVDSDLLRKLISNRTILVGYDLTGGSDLVTSPVHGKIAGVFMHAVALDNIIRYGDDYWHVPPATGIFNLSIADILEITVQTIVLFFVVWYRYTHIESSTGRSQTPDNSQILSGVKPLLLVILFVFASILVSQLSFKMGIANWYALPLILILDIPIFLYYLLEWLKQKFATTRNRILDNAKGKLTSGLKRKI